MLKQVIFVASAASLMEILNLVLRDSILLEMEAFLRVIFIFGFKVSKVVK